MAALGQPLREIVVVDGQPAVEKLHRKGHRRQALGRGCVAHWLRHAHASHALDNGVPIQLVGQTLGHGSITTTSVYAHAKPNDGRALYLDEIS